MKLIILLLFISCSHSRKKPASDSQYIDLNKKTANSVTHKFSYDEGLINSPNFSVDQYHPGLSDLFKNDSVSLLCQPAVIASALIQDYRDNPKARNLKLDGNSADGKSIDSNAVVKQLTECMNYDPEKGSSSINGANCLANINKFVGVNYEVILIGLYQKDYLNSLDDKVKLNNRVPTSSDIIYYLKNGYHIAGMIDFFTLDQNKQWEFTEGHVVSINGYARQSTWPKNLLYTFIMDPSFSYKSSQYPRVHQFLLSKSSNTKGLPEWTSNLFLEGATMTGFYDRAFLSGLLVFKIK